MQIIMGSRSSIRRSLLSRLTPDFLTLSADIDEAAIRSSEYALLPLLLARAKADVLLAQTPADCILITSDQVVICNGELREKPQSVQQEREWLKSYAVNPAQTNTAVVVHNVALGTRFGGLDIARVQYGEIPDEVIEKLIETGDVFYAAGGFLLEDELMAPYVRSVEGEPESIMGLPLALTTQLLVAAGAAQLLFPEALRRYGTIGP